GRLHLRRHRNRETRPWSGSFFDGDVEVVEMAAGDISGVVHAATVIGPPPLRILGEGPDASLPDQILHPERFGVGLEPVGDRPPVLERGPGSGLADGIAERHITGATERMLGSGAWAWRVATPPGARERGSGVGHDVQHPGPDLSATGGFFLPRVVPTCHSVGCGCVSACGATRARRLAAVCFGCAVFCLPGVSVDGVASGASGTNLEMQVRPC